MFTKSDLMALANKGKTQINGITVEVIERESAGNNGLWVDIHVEQFTPFAAPLLLGQKWTEYITDEECAELPAALERYKAEALAFETKAQSKHMRLASLDNNTVIELDTDKPRKYHKEIFNTETGFMIHGVDCMIALDGVEYAPIWSYWMNHACYEYAEQKAAK